MNLAGSENQVTDARCAFRRNGCKCQQKSRAHDFTLEVKIDSWANMGRKATGHSFTCGAKKQELKALGKGPTGWREPAGGQRRCHTTFLAPQGPMGASEKCNEITVRSY